MQDLEKDISTLLAAYRAAVAQLDLETKTKELDDITKETEQANFWEDSVRAQAIMQRQAALKSATEPWLSLGKDLDELKSMADLKDNTLLDDLKKQRDQLQATFDTIKQDLKFSGPYDDHNAILTLSAGAGGTDAQDWTAMLLRMYTRWAEKANFTVQLLEESAGEEAGLKRATIEINGIKAFGMLKGEHGVHRLVRLSPFNSDSLRQTSFAKVDVVPEVKQASELEIDEKELKVDVYRAGGHGGQSVNTTDSAVRITHIPTGLTVAIQNERSQLQNKETAMTILRSRLAALQLEQHKEKLSELKGPHQSAEWGNQIRSYVLHPYKQVKDARTKYETSDAEGVLDGDLQPLITAYLDSSLGS